MKTALGEAAYCPLVQGRQGPAGPSGRAGPEPPVGVDELGDGLGLHLFHDLRPVRLDRALGGSQGGRDLLVQAAGHDEVEDLSLPGSELRESLRQLPAPAVGFRHRLLPYESLPDRFEQLLALDGLGQEVRGALAHRADALGDVDMARQEDHGQAVATLGHGLVELESARAGHAHIEEDAAGPVAGGLEKEVSSGAVGPDLVSARTEQPRDGRPKGRVVVDDVDDGGLAAHVAGSGTDAASSRARVRSCGDAGRKNRNVAPPLGLFSATMVPPWASTIERQIESPSPTPCFLVVKKDWNRRWRSPSDMP